MEKENPGYTPGPYYGEAIARSYDIVIRSKLTGESVAQIVSRSSGNESAPDDKTALQNASLFMRAPQMRDVLRAAVDGEREPLHPGESAAARAVLAKIESVDHQEILRARDALRWQEKRKDQLTGRRAGDQMNDYFRSEEWLRYKYGSPEYEGKAAAAPAHTRGPYNVQALAESHDISVFSEATQERVARVLSRDSGHPSAPADRAALFNASLFRAAPRMRESLELILRHEHEPMHPLIANGIRDILRDVELGAAEQITADRRFYREIAASPGENATAALDHDEEEQDYSIDY